MNTIESANIRISYNTIANICGSSFAHRYIGAEMGSVSLAQILSDLQFLSKIEHSKIY